ncbi:hypothetical protein K402DRAFT_468056 [Aulographum hederae CBS 113979]|uniref:CFEM domain-containing protein n=1 Tax=Aulographum hederae CBS 113979 TaxID=1176131 RepID=A0A6G1GJ59_9PEZI|nr:hypothetical protein K402DRAFT_468056 [Aulographum hederae CBS 113979]
MKLLALAFVNLFVAITSAQSNAQIPRCAIRCFEEAIASSSCAPQDYNCICITQANPLTQHIAECLLGGNPCTVDEQNSIIPAIGTICDGALHITAFQTDHPAPLASGLHTMPDGNIHDSMSMPMPTETSAPAPDLVRARLAAKGVGFAGLLAGWLAVL